MINVTDNETNVIPLVDSREKLESDVREWCERSLAIFPEARERIIYEWLDRQAAITERETGKCRHYHADEHYCDIHETRINALNERIDELTKKLEDLTEERDCWKDQVRKCAKALKATVDEFGRTHVRLPVDADGVPIHLGDLLVRENGDEHYCHGIGKPSLEVMDEHCSWWRSECFRHVQPDTVESLVDELFSIANLPSETEERHRSEIVAEYAERIRKAVEHG